MARNSCILRVNRMFDGDFSEARSRTYRCKVGEQVMEVHRVATAVAWRFGGGIECDESEPIVPNSLISVKGSTMIRSDGFAHFSGPMTITDHPEDLPPVLLFVGRMDLIARIGSHQFLGEKCDEPHHYEGWLAASGRGHLDGHRLRCVVVGSGELPGGLADNTLINRISGTLFLPAH